MKQNKILIIDDEFPIRYLIEHQLRRQGYDVILAKDGASGIREARELQPDLIVLDAMMPNMDGFEVCAQIRTEADTAEIPVIFLTALESNEYKSRAFAVGADDYLVKPFQAEELLAHVTAVLKRAERERTGTLETQPGKVVSLFSPKGGVGTSTLAIQLSEAIALHESRPIVLMDLNWPLGSIAPMLNLNTHDTLAELLQLKTEHISTSSIGRYMQQHRADMHVIPASGNILTPPPNGSSAQINVILEQITKAGYLALLDLGSHLTPLTLQAMRRSHAIFLVTSGQPIANALTNAFIKSAHQMQLDPNRLLPVINELHGQVKANDVPLSRVPVARIPHTDERSRTRLWLKEQGLRKLISIVA